MVAENQDQITARMSPNGFQKIPQTAKAGIRVRLKKSAEAPNIALRPPPGVPRIAAISPKEAAAVIKIPAIPGSPISARITKEFAAHSPRIDSLRLSKAPITSVAIPKRRDTKLKVINGTGRCPIGFAVWGIEVVAKLPKITPS